MAGLLDLLMSAMQAAGGKGDRLRDPASNRVAQAFDAASGGPQGGLSPDQALAYAKSVNPAMRAPETPQQADPWQGLRDVTPGAGVDPMQTASAGPAPGDPNLAWQRGMGSSEGPPAPQGGPGGGGGLNWRELLRALGPALMMADPLGRNQGMAAMMMRQTDERRKGAKDSQAQNQTRQWLLSQGMDEGTAAMMVSDPVLLRQWFGERGKAPEKKSLVNAGDGQLYDPNTGEWISAPGGRKKPPQVVEIFDEASGQPYKATWDEETGEYKRVGGVKARSGMELTTNPDGTVSLTQGPLSGRPKLTEGEAKNAGFLERGLAAQNVLDQLEGEGTSLFNKTVGNIPIVGNYMRSEDAQKYDQAKRDFVNAVLRRESGAVISPDEFANAEQQYFPQPGDGPEVITQKKANRAAAVKGFDIGAGQGAGMVTRPPEQTQKRLRFIPETGELE